jgi:hypothetical protein
MRVRGVVVHAGPAERGGGVRRPARGREDAQAMVEFALVFGLVMLLVLGVAQTGLYAVERSVAYDSAEAGVMAATGADSSPAGGPAMESVAGVVEPLLDRGLIGAQAAEMAPSGGTCPGLSESWPVGTVYVCSYQPTPGTVAVTVRGWVAALVPVGFGLGESRFGALPLDILEVAHVATFAP